MLSKLAKNGSFFADFGGQAVGGFVRSLLLFAEASGRGMQLRVADCDKGIGGAVDSYCVAVSRRLGGLASACGNGWRNGNGTGKPVCGGSSEGK